MICERGTITGADWRRSLTSARRRVPGGAARIRAQVQCPVCKRPGILNASSAGGCTVAHGVGIVCRTAQFEGGRAQ